MRYQIYVATRKGLLIGNTGARPAAARLHGGEQQKHDGQKTDPSDRADWHFDDPHFLGWQVDYATRDPRSGRIWVGASHMQWGPHLHYSDDEGASWQEGVSPSFEGLTTRPHAWDDDANQWQAGAEQPASLNRIWTIEPGLASQPGVLYAGVDPAALFISDDNGASWNICNALWNHPTRDAWTPGLAGLILHHIQVDPRDAQHIYIGISAAGIFESRDAGVTWTPRNRGVAGEHLPLGGQEEVGHCAHSFSLHPAQPDRLYQRNHFGVYRSDDGGATWVDLGDGLPGEFGFASTIDPNDADTFYTVPLQFDQPARASRRATARRPSTKARRCPARLPHP